MLVLTHALALLSLPLPQAEPTLQERIDAAEPGARIELGPGAFDERLTITKPIALVGAGWEATRLLPTEAGEGEPVQPTVAIDTTGRVELVGLRLGAFAVPAREGTVGSFPIVRVRGADLLVSECAVVGPADNGVVVEAGAHLAMKGSLIAAMFNTGLVVAPGARGAAVTASVIRSCYHRGVTIGAEGVSLNACWISGSAWHGIRYDGVSPRIEDCLIYGNARSGIYASGATEATVAGNLFWRNEMSGLSCWFDNRDTVRGNSFLFDLRESVAVAGAARPLLEANLFAGAPVAVRCSQISGGGEERGAPRLVDNRLVGEGLAFRSAGEGQASVEGLRPVDQALATLGEVEIDARDPQLDPLVASSPFPDLLEEEVRILPQGTSRDWRGWNRELRERDAADAAYDREAFAEGYQAEIDAAQPWVEAALQIRSSEDRERAVADILAALESEDVVVRRQGLAGFFQLHEVRFDKAAARERIVGLMAAEDPVSRVLAGSGLLVCGASAEDLPRYVALARDPHPDVRLRAVLSLVFAADHELTGEVGEVIVERLAKDPPADRRNLLASLWGGRFSPELEAKLIELSREPGQGNDPMYYALSTQANKSAACVERLIELLSDPDEHNVAGRAAWGLGQGVSEPEYPLVAEAALGILVARSRGRLFQSSLGLLESYAGPEQVSGIREVAGLPGVDDDLRERLDRIAETAAAR